MQDDLSAFINVQAGMTGAGLSDATLSFQQYRNITINPTF
jgi:hypothetical protein